MSESYSYGSTAKRGTRLPSIDRGKLAVGLLVAAVLLAGWLVASAVLRDGADAAAGSTTTAVGGIDVARDAEAQVTLSRVAVAAQTVMAQAATGSPDAATAEALRAAEPVFTYTTDASTGSEIVSVAATPASWSAAVLSSSGSCLWIRIDAAGAQTFGAGMPCTGAAAAAASATSW